jgi:hypothetical protein
MPTRTQSPETLVVTLTNEALEISAKPVKNFLDAVDTVLNSNTFILQFSILLNDIKKSLDLFLKSDTFINQLIFQDRERNWFNMQYFDGDTGRFKVKPGNLLNKDAKLIISEPSVDKREYLIAMLTGDTSVGSFYSNKRNER